MTTKTRGIYIEPAHAKLIHNNSKNLIIKDKFFKINQDDMVLITTENGQDKALGMIRLQRPASINIKEFKQYRKYHKISDETRRSQWPHAQKLFAYKVKQYCGFQSPKDIDVIVHNDIVSDVNLSAKRNINIKVSDYTPANIPDDRLKSDFRQLCAISTRRQTRFSNDDIILLGRKIMPELMRRGIKFNKTGMQPATLKLINKITNDKEFNMKFNFNADKPKSDGENYSTALKYDLSDIKDMDGFRQIEHAETTEGQDQHTYDLYFAGNEYWLADDSIIKWRSLKDRPHEAVEEWHRITGLRLKLEDCAQYDAGYIVHDPDKIYDNASAYIISNPDECGFLKEASPISIPVFVPEDKADIVKDWHLEDLRVLKKGTAQEYEGYSIKWTGDEVEIIDIKPAAKIESEFSKCRIFTRSTIELDFIKPTKPYLDMDAHVSNEFFVLEDMKDFDYTNKTLEKKYDGQRLQIHKRGNSVKCYTAYGNQISLNKLGNIPNEIRAINSHAFILDGELILPNLDRDYVHDAVTTEGSDELEYRVFDILQVNDSRLIDKPLCQRRQILERLPPSSHVKVSPALKVTKDNIKGMLKEIHKRGYEGAVIKDTNSLYQDRKAWHKFVFITNYLKKTEDMQNMTEDESRDYRITLNRLDRKLREGKRIPMAVTELYEQNTIIQNNSAKPISAPKFTLTRRFCWWYHPKKKKRTRNSKDYHLKMECPSAYKFHLDKNPQTDTEISATAFTEGGKYFRPGEYQPGTDLNQDNQESVHIEKICEGGFDMIQEEQDMMEIKFKGRKFNGTFIFKRNGETWTMTKVTKSKQLSKLQFGFKDFRNTTSPVLANDIKFPYRRRTIAFAPGFWHHTVYTWDIIKEAAMKMKGIPMVMEHSDEILDDLGTVTDVFINEQDQRIEVEFELIDTVNGKDAAILLENGKIPAVSVALEEWSDEIDGKNTCTQIVGFGHVALVKYPECAPALICDKDGTCG